MIDPIKYKLVGGPFHGRKFEDRPLAPLLSVRNGGEETHYYRFLEMRGNRYYVYVYVNACSDVALVS